MSEERDLDWAEPAARTPFTQVPNWVVDSELSIYAKGAYLAIARHINGGSGDAWPGVDRLAGMVGCGTTKLNDALIELRTFGALTTTRRGLGRTNLYRLCFTAPRRSCSPRGGVLEDRPAAPKKTERNKTENEQGERVRADLRGLAGDDLSEVIRAITQGAHASADRKFLGLWVGGDDTRVEDLLRHEAPAVRVAVASWLVDQATAGWKGRSIAIGVANGPLAHARTQAEAEGRHARPLSAAEEQAARIERRKARIRGDA